MEIWWITEQKDILQNIACITPTTVGRGQGGRGSGKGSRWLPGSLSRIITEHKPRIDIVSYSTKLQYLNLLRVHIFTGDCVWRELARRDGAQRDFGKENFDFCMANNARRGIRMTWRGIWTFWWGLARQERARQRKIQTFVTPTIPGEDQLAISPRRGLTKRKTSPWRRRINPSWCFF